MLREIIEGGGEGSSEARFFDGLSDDEPAARYAVYVNPQAGNQLFPGREAAEGLASFVSSALSLIGAGVIAAVVEGQVLRVDDDIVLVGRLGQPAGE